MAAEDPLGACKAGKDTYEHLARRALEGNAVSVFAYANKATNAHVMLGAEGTAIPCGLASVFAGRPAGSEIHVSCVELMGGHILDLCSNLPEGAAAPAGAAPAVAPHQALQNAQEASHCLSTKAITELRAFQRPPASVVTVMQAVMVALGHHSTEWTDCKKLMASSSFVSDLIGFDLGGVTDDTLHRLQPLVRDLDPQRVRAVSVCAASMAQWVLAVVQYATISRAAHAVPPLPAPVTCVLEGDAIAGLTRVRVDSVEEALAKLNAAMPRRSAPAGASTCICSVYVKREGAEGCVNYVEAAHDAVFVAEAASRLGDVARSLV